MRKALGKAPVNLRLWLLTFSFCSLFLLYTTDPSQAVYSYGAGLRGQKLVWQTLSRTQTYWAIQALFALVFCLPVATLGLFFCWRLARALWLIWLLAAFVFFYLDPRFRNEDWLQLLRGLGTVLCGSGAYKLSSLPDPGLKGSAMLRQVLILCCFAAALVLGSLFTEGSPQASVGELLLSGILFLGGLLSYAVWLGEEKKLFTAALPKRQLSSAKVFALFGLHTALLISLGYLAYRDLARALILPFTSFLGFAVGTWSWLSQTGAPLIFGDSATTFGTGDLATSRSLLYLVIFFQYLSLVAATSFLAALRRKTWPTTICSHLCYLLYWLPNFVAFFEGDKVLGNLLAQG